MLHFEKPLSEKTADGNHRAVDPGLAAARFVIAERGLAGAARALGGMSQRTLARVAAGAPVKFGTLVALHASLVELLGPRYADKFGS